MKFEPQLGLISQLCLHVNIGFSYHKSVNRWKMEVKFKSDLLKRELFSIQSKWIIVKISMT